MFYELFLIVYFTFNNFIESALIGATGRNRPDENLFYGHLSSLFKLSDRYPDRQIEFQLQFNVPEHQVYNPLKMHNLRRTLIDPVIQKTQRSDSIMESSTETTKNKEITTSLTQPTTAQDQVDAKREPIYLDDLKKAIEDFEKKQLQGEFIIIKIYQVEFIIILPCSAGLRETSLHLRRWAAASPYANRYTAIANPPAKRGDYGKPPPICETIRNGP
ncbi:hypothetical protein evm_005541 [Chilo suppressalis]|nr:hypothetical protein evm_005541 [Chilo suppressalis]